jgi:intraflagellar transport protein 172
MRLVGEFRNDLVETTHLHLAQQLEGEGDTTGAEAHFIAAGDWKSAVRMLRSHNLWERAYKVDYQSLTTSFII